MAEVITAIGIISNIFQLVDLGNRVLTRITDSQCRSRFQCIEMQIPLLLDILNRLRNSIDKDIVSKAGYQVLKQTILSCQDQIEALSRLLHIILPSPGDSMFQRTIKAIKSFREEGKVAVIQKALEEHKTTLILYCVQLGNERSLLPIEYSHSPYFGTPALRVKQFIGRTNEIAAIDEAIGDLGMRTLHKRVVVIIGMGGTGKTQLTLEFCHQASVAGKFSTIFWIDASSLATVSRSFESILEMLPNSPRSLPDAAAKIAFVKYAIRTSTKPWLLVFDNFDWPCAFQERPIQSFFPAGGCGAFIITSRHKGSQRLGNTIHLENMSEANCLELLFQRSGRKQSAKSVDDAKALVDRLGYLPLAIDQAAAYINTRNIDLQDFVESYDSRKESVLKHTPELWEYRRVIDQGNTESLLSVFTTWEVSVGFISNDHYNKDSKVNFLTVSAFLNNFTISEYIFRQYSSGHTSDPDWMEMFKTSHHWDRYKFEDVIVELSSLSLIQNLGYSSDYGYKFLMHPIVRDWVKLRISYHNRQLFAKEAILMVTNSIDENYSEQLPLHKKRDILAYLDSCVTNADLYLEGTNSFVGGGLRNAAVKFACFYKRQARYDEAKRLWMKIVRARENDNGADDLKTLDATFELGNVFGKEGQYQKAQDLYARTVAGYEKWFGMHQEDSSRLLANPTYGCNEVSDENCRDFPRGPSVHLPGQRHLLGYLDESAASVVRLATAYRKQGRYSEAILWYTTALSIQEKLLGSDHLDTFKTLMNLAVMKCEMGELVEAENILERVVSGRERKQGKDHLNTLRAVYNLARVCSMSGKYKHSEILYDRALREQEKQLGHDHPFTLKTAKDFAQLRYLQGNYIEAEILYMRAISGLSQKCGSEHPNTLSAATGLSNVYREQGKYLAAQELHSKTLSVLETHLGYNRPNVLRAVRDLGILFYRVGKLKEAKEVLERAREEFTRLFGPWHRDIVECNQHIAKIGVFKETVS
ncbi:hypothetical protein BP6252_11005 [Coleophoma cylindrospora]|uniref:NB-ARC domain-containing protein n=1 Tax=Coleophoma cylindrospora TaxID=1849047 RepID=A0A3D8QP95_9HELO|nr:hypothetical protein BP6252_11005 [Coleophoma cylindrospora]